VRDLLTAVSFTLINIVVLPLVSFVSSRWYRIELAAVDVVAVSSAIRRSFEFEARLQLPPRFSAVFEPPPMPAGHTVL